MSGRSEVRFGLVERGTWEDPMISAGGEYDVRRPVRASRASRRIDRCFFLLQQIRYDTLLAVLDGFSSTRSFFDIRAAASSGIARSWTLNGYFRAVSEIGARPLRNDDELIALARKVWPRLPAHALTEAKNQSFDERVALGAEVWCGKKCTARSQRSSIAGTRAATGLSSHF